jgi:hypothetical protein
MLMILLRHLCTAAIYIWYSLSRKRLHYFYYCKNRAERLEKLLQEEHFKI